MSTTSPPLPDKDLDRASARQQIASDPGYSVWVSANAGTGKTRVLIDRISRLLLSGVRPERILCLTYTKAAAAEMENRLSARLGLWATMNDASLHSELLQLVGKQIETKDIMRARQLFAETLEAPGGMKIRTIHAFCESVLGRFPVEAHIAPHTSIMDERAAASVITEAQSIVYQRGFSDDAALGTALETMAGLVDEGGFGELMKEVLNKRQTLSRCLHQHGGPRGLEASLEQALGLEPNATPEQVLMTGIRDSAFDHGALKDVIKALETGTKGDKERAQDISSWLSLSDADRARTYASHYKPIFMRNTDDQPRAESRMMSKTPAEAYPQAKIDLLAEQDRVYALSESLKSVAIKDGTMNLVTIADALTREYETLKRRRALLDYDDLIHKTLTLLERDHGAGWVHYKLDGGIDHILVDEAQDTSPEQWDIVRHLAHEFFAGEGSRSTLPAGATPLPDRSIFAVGDEKQSIYSFQGADPAGFARMRQYFSDIAGDVLKSIQLEQSFRTTGAVLNVVDAVFTQPTAQAGVVDGAGTYHRAQRSGHAGVVEMWPSVHKLPTQDPTPWHAPVDRVRETSPMAQTAETVAKVISDWLSNNEMLESHRRPVESGDIMILVPKRGQFADEMVRRLKARNIPVAGSDRMVMTDQIAIMDLIAVARFVLLPEDDLNLATVLKGPFIGFSEEDVFAVAHGRSGSMWQSIRNLTEARFCEAVNILNIWLARADFAPPYEFFATLLGPEGGRRHLMSRLGAEANDPIDEFLNQALAYENDQIPSLQGFLAWIDAAATEIKRDMEAAHGKVRVMTVHGSKGLEANIVILPDTCSAPDGRTGNKILWAGDLPLWPGLKQNETSVCAALRDDLKRRRMEEYRRLMYVAMTRARDRLYVTGWERKSGPKDSEHGRDEDSWYELIRPAVSQMDRVETSEHDLGTSYRVATPQQEPPESDDTSVPVLTAAKNIPDWISRPPDPEPEPTVPLSPSRASEDEPPVRPPIENGNTNRFQRGILVHRLLQSLPNIPPDSRTDAARRWVALSVPGMEQAERNAIVNETLAVLDNPMFAEVFGPDSLAEVPVAGTVTTTAGPQTISGQLDRLVVTDTSVTVVDYKTNRPPPLDQKDVPKAYIRQMGLYKSALEHIYEGREIRCLLVWTDGPQAMLLNKELLSDYAP